MSTFITGGVEMGIPILISHAVYYLYTTWSAHVTCRPSLMRDARYVDARDNYSETELKNRTSVCEQRQFDAPWSGGQARQGRERQSSVAAPNRWMTLYYTKVRDRRVAIFRIIICRRARTALLIHLSSRNESCETSNTGIDVSVRLFPCYCFRMIHCVRRDELGAMWELFGM